MSHLDPHESFAAATRTLRDEATALDFDRDEWTVIALARRDSLASLRPPSAAARLLGRLFGGGAERRLANPRLEALRRFAVLAWHYGYTLPVSAMKAFKQAGYSLDHIELLLASVESDRQRIGRRTAA